jgi:hypothetical protein
MVKKKIRHTKATREGWRVSFIPKVEKNKSVLYGVISLFVLLFVFGTVMVFTDFWSVPIDVPFGGIDSGNDKADYVDNIASKEEAGVLVQDMSVEISEILDELSALDSGLGK